MKAVMPFARGSSRASRALRGLPQVRRYDGWGAPSWFVDRHAEATLNCLIKRKLEKEKRMLNREDRMLRMLTGDHDFTPRLANLLIECLQRPVAEYPVTIKPALASDTCKTPNSKFKGLGLFSSRPIEAGSMVLCNPGTFWSHEDLCTYSDPIPDEIFDKVMNFSWHAPDVDWYAASEDGEPSNIYSLSHYINHGNPNMTRWKIPMPRRVLLEACKRLHKDCGFDPLGLEEDPTVAVTGYVAIRDIKEGEELMMDYALGTGCEEFGFEEEWWWEPIKTRYYVEWWQSMGVENPMLEAGVTDPGDPWLRTDLDIKGTLVDPVLAIEDRWSEVPVRNGRGNRNWADQGYSNDVYGTREQG